MERTTYHRSTFACACTALGLLACDTLIEAPVLPGHVQGCVVAPGGQSCEAVLPNVALRNVCGDGHRDPTEECDDGNLVSGDDCDASCRFGGVCSDTCASAGDGRCDDGGLGADSAACAYGSDCGDCSPRREDPCLEFPVEGACVDGATINMCSNGSVTTRRCDAGSVCAADPESLGAACVPSRVAECTPGASACSGESLLECDARGHWQRTVCSSACVPFALGDHCPADAGAPSLPGVLRYEARTANQSMTNWGAPFVSGLGSAMVVSYVWNPETSTHAVFDVAVSGEGGVFGLRVPSTPGPEDLVVVWLAGLDEDGAIAYAVANPSFDKAGAHPVTDVARQAGSGELWSFSLPLSTLAESPEILLDIATHQGTARVFDHMRYVHNTTARILGARGNPLVAWMQPDVSWDCGACSARQELKVGAHTFGGNLWIPQDEDQAYWSDAVIAHELGHWVMDSYGTSPREGGKHFIGQPTMPGQAWSEGFATFFSSLARADARYFDKRRGTFFWFDLAEIGYAGRDLMLPTADAEGYPFADDAVLQRVDENVVAAMAYAVALEGRGENAEAPTLENEGRFFLEALNSPRMNVRRTDPTALFPRRYVRHTWSLDDDRQLVDITPIWTAPAPMFADYLDALRCLGDERGRDMDPVIAESILTYPYPINSKAICL